MAVQLNHTIVRAHDKHETARFLVEILGLPEPATVGPFLEVKVANDVSLDVADDQGKPHMAHYAFLVSEDEFDAIHGRIQERGLPYWADPLHRRPGEINHEDGGRGLYWDDPNGHILEILTVPYGGWG
jgi:extradiol dioxygenase family protein